MILGNTVTAEVFLKEYWQKKPLLIKNAFDDFHDPISPEELAGLACEEEADARLVFTEPEQQQQWRLKNGPFSENDFTSLPDHNWTLLVQAVDQWFPKLKDLYSSLNFIPNWRIDDIMVSYAEKNAGVGPHFDYYDVFLIQGEGSRTWQTGQPCDSKSILNTDSGLKILETFDSQQTFHLNTGDVLYIPPGIAHYGISDNSSMSYSIGFRAPSASELLIAYSDEICASLNDDQRYSDPKPLQVKQTGEIDSSSLQQVLLLLRSCLDNEQLLPDCFGRHITEQKQEHAFFAPEHPISPQELLAAFAEGEILCKNPISRFAFTLIDDNLSFYADGESFKFINASKNILSLNRLLNESKGEDLDLSLYFSDSESLNFLAQLYNQGSLHFTD